MRALFIILTICLIVIPAQAKYSGGTGDPNDPYQIATVEDLMLLGDSPEDYDKHFILTADIDLDPNLPGRKVFDRAVIAPDIDPIPNQYGYNVYDGTSFAGVFDGNGHTISHLTIIGESYLGLFGHSWGGHGGEVKNLGLLHGGITGSGNYVGGLVGYNDRGTVTQCYSSGEVSGYESIGELVGENRYGSIATCYSNGSVIGWSRVGSLVGHNSGGSIDTSHSSGEVSGYESIGGLVGENRYGGIATCYGNTSVDGRSVTGGLVGWNEGDVKECYSTGVVYGDHDVGGLVGFNGWDGHVTQCYSMGVVNGTVYTGGLVGWNEGYVKECYSIGAVIGDRDVGGLVGIGSPAGIMHSVWDIETSDQSGSAGGVGLTTTDMMDPYMLGLNGFANDPNWILDAGRDYPRLSWEGTAGNIIPEPNIDLLEGVGTAEAPYRIDTVDQLVLFGKASILWDKHIVLGADIDLDPNLPGGLVFGQAVIPVFTGIFDGNGHTISHLTIQGGEVLGLFGYLGSTATVANLGLKAVEVCGTGSYVGGLVGSNGSEGTRGGTVTQCYSSGSVSGTSDVGGLVGCNWNSRITSSYSTGSVRGQESIGGFAGSNGGDLVNCYSTGAVIATGTSVGGLVGGIGSTTMSMGSVLGTNEGSTQGCFWDIQTSGLSESVGGVGLTTDEAMDPQMLGLNGFAKDPNWILDIGHDYPKLTWEGTAGNIIPESDIDWLDGNGTKEIPYCITTVDQLIQLGKASLLWESHFVLGANIDLDPHLPGRCIFSQAVIPAFMGVFDGSGHKISHLTVHGKYYLGLFGVLTSGAEVKNLGVVDVNITGSGWSIGGLVGENKGSDISQCYSTGVVYGDHDVGGLVGFNGWDGHVTQCYSDGAVSGSYAIGGLVGHNYYGGVTQCYSMGAVSGKERVGGLVGDKQSSAVDSFWDTQTSGQAKSAGGKGMTTAEMQTASTFLEAGWDFVDEVANGTEDIWWILEGQDYPRLWWERGP
jgi:hypothetical protein